MAAADQDVRSDRRSERRLITLLGIAQICSWGSIYYSFPLLAEAMRLDLGWSKSLLYGASTLGLVLSALAAYPVGSAIDRGHGRQVMALSSVAAGLLLLLWSQAESVVTFYVAAAGAGCLQAATLYEPAFAVVARRFGSAGARRGITALTLWGGFASTVFIPLIQFLIDTAGWRGALIVLGAVNILVCATLYVIAIDPARDAPPHTDVPGMAPMAGRRAVAWAIRKPVFWALAVAFVAYAWAAIALTFHLYPLLLERGLGAAEVVAVMAVIGPAQVAGRLVIWRLAPNAPVRVFGSIVVVAFPLAVAGLAFAPATFWTLAAIAALYGAANGMITIVRGLAVPEMLSREAYGAINGALATPMRLVQAGAPLTAAWIWTATGGYDDVLLAVLASMLLLVASFWAAALLARPRA